MKNILFLVFAFAAFADAQLFYDKFGESRGAYKDSLEYSRLVELSQRFRGPILVRPPVEGVKPRKNLEKIPQNKIQRTFNMSLDSLRELWGLEVSKKEFVQICIDGTIIAWETSLNSNIHNDSCLVFQAPSHIGNESIDVYLPDSKRSQRINLAVGKKLNFKKEKVLLGYEYFKQREDNLLDRYSITFF